MDLTRHPKFPLAFGELASGRFPHCNAVLHFIVWQANRGYFDATLDAIYYTGAWIVSKITRNNQLLSIDRRGNYTI